MVEEHAHDGSNLKALIRSELEARRLLRFGHEIVLETGGHVGAYFDARGLMFCPPVGQRIANMMARHMQTLSHFPAEGCVILGAAQTGAFLARDVCAELCDRTGAGFDFIPTTRAVVVNGESRSMGFDQHMLDRDFGAICGRDVFFVDDHLGTGRTLRQVVRILEAANARLLGVFVLCSRQDRIDGLGCPFDFMVRLESGVWTGDDCPHCNQS